MHSPPRGPTFSVRMFGTPVRVGLGFPAVMIGLGWMSTHDVGLLVVWALLVTTSVLVHEAGHAVALRAHGFAPSIALTAMGGVTSTRERRSLSTWRSIGVSLAGPAAGIALGLVVELCLLGARSGTFLWLRHASWFVNIWWSLFNLLPIMPLDGGHVIRELAQRATRERGRAILDAVAVTGAITALLWWALRGRPPIVFVLLIALMCGTVLAHLEITASQREAYRLSLAHEQILRGELPEGIATLLPVTLGPRAERVDTEAYTTLGWALLHERRYADLAALDPARFHPAHRSLLTGATAWFRGELPRATADVLDALANGTVDPPDTYFRRVFLRLGELDRLSSQIASLPRDSAHRAAQRLHSSLAGTRS